MYLKCDHTDRTCLFFIKQCKCSKLSDGVMIEEDAVNECDELDENILGANDCLTLLNDVLAVGMLWKHVIF